MGLLMKNIVLAHGVLGFETLFGSIDYFNGVVDHLEKQGHSVIAPPVAAIGDITTRGRQLADAINKKWPISQNDEVHIIAHSMGGLDARYALANQLIPQVKTLVTIGTPHNGSLVADAIVNPTLPLFNHIPEPIRSFLTANAGAFNDLTTASTAHNAMPDVTGVRYIDIAGDASLGDPTTLVLFGFAGIIRGLTHEVNDGMVVRSSALHAGHEHLDDWPTDHIGEVGWYLNSFTPSLISSIFSWLPSWIPLPRNQMAQHLARYDAIINRI